MDQQRDSDSDRSTEMILEVDGTEIADIRTFSYVSDVMQIACPFSAEIPDPASKWSKIIYRGAPVNVYLRNPDINNGAKTLKMKGRVENVQQAVRMGTGRVLRVTGFDLGWHLMHDCGKLGFNLSKATYRQLLDKVLNKSWGFQGVRFGEGNAINRQIKLGRAQKLLQYTAANEVPLQYIGIEPGEQLSSLLTEVARFAALLLTVSADGYLTAWNPDYDRKPQYSFENYPDTDPRRNQNNLLDIEVNSSAAQLATDITCVGEILLVLDHSGDPNGDPSPHPGRKIGKVVDRSILPYSNTLIYADTEQFSPAYCQANAAWKFKRNAHDSWSYKCSSPCHHQNGVWFEADMMCAVTDLVNHDDTAKPIKNIVGKFWIPSIEMHWDKDRGGGTSFLIRKAGLLKAPIVGVGGDNPYDRAANTKVIYEPAPKA